MLEAHEEFVGLYVVESTQATVLHSVVLVRLSLSFTKLRGQCYDGAASISGARIGIVKEPRIVYTLCYGHSLNLAYSDAIKGCCIC